LVSHQAVPLTVYNKIALISMTKQRNIENAEAMNIVNVEPQVIISPYSGLRELR